MKWIYYILLNCVPITIWGPGGMTTVLQCCTPNGGCQIVIM